MEGELKKLRDDYNPSYDISNIETLTFAQLSLIKKEVENELFKLLKYLQDDLKSDMNSPLIDQEGFPLEATDIIGIRLTRIKIIKYKNDLKTIIEIIDQRLIHEFKSQDNKTIQNTIPFVKIDEVLPSSPSQQAGLQLNDKIVAVKKDSTVVNVTNHDNLKYLIKLIKSNVGTPIQITILRNGELHSLGITPSLNWPGSNGVLGCKLTPL